jgi:hypothetical protein
MQMPIRNAGDEALCCDVEAVLSAVPSVLEDLRIGHIWCY